MARSIAAPGPRRIARRSSLPTFGVLHPFAGAVRLARTGAAFAWQRRWPRVALLALLIALPLLGGGWLWLRQSPFVAVQRVTISGVHGPEAAEIETAIAAAARQMSTLNVHAGALRAATASFPVVREVRALPRFPHGLDVKVIEQLPVAALLVGGTRTAVAADGVVLGPALLNGSLPTVSGYSKPAVGQHLHAPDLLGALTVLGAAPAALARHVERVFTGAEGLTVAMRNGLLVYFGDAARPHAKWLSLARVLADSSSVGASYIDVRLPGRPAAGFPAGVLPPDASAASAAGSGEQTGSTESTVAALAAGLTSGTGIEPASASSASSASEPSSEAAAEPASETASGATAEPEAATQTEAPPSSSTTGG